MTNQLRDHAPDTATIDRLSTAFNRCFVDFEADDDLFTDDAFFDLMPPLWRFQLVGGDAFVKQLQSIAEGPVTCRRAPGPPHGRGVPARAPGEPGDPRGPGDGPPRVDVRGATTAASPRSSATATVAGTTSCAPGTPPRPRWCDRERRHRDHRRRAPPDDRGAGGRDRGGAARAARPARRPHRRRLLRRARPHQPRRRGGRHRDRHAPVRRPRRRRRVGGVDRDDRRGRLVRSRHLAPRHLRRRLREGPRRHRGRRVQPGRVDHAGQRRLPGRGPMGVRQRVRARRLDLRQLRRRARGRPPDAPRRPVHPR